SCTAPSPSRRSTAGRGSSPWRRGSTVPRGSVSSARCRSCAACATPEGLLRERDADGRPAWTRPGAGARPQLAPRRLTSVARTARAATPAPPRGRLGAEVDAGRVPARLPREVDEEPRADADVEQAPASGEPPERRQVPREGAHHGIVVAIAAAVGVEHGARLGEQLAAERRGLARRDL